MERNFDANARIIKALSDPSRLKIIDILSCGEQCACDILEEFAFTQPTLSHHMKVLMGCGLVNSRKKGLWSYYSLHISNCNKLMLFLMGLITDTECTGEAKIVSKSKCDCEIKGEKLLDLIEDGEVDRNGKGK